MNIILNDRQAAVLKEENEKQAHAASFALDDPSDEAADAYAAAAQGTPGMDEICALQASLPKSSCLCWPDGTVARYAGTQNAVYCNGRELGTLTSEEIATLLAWNGAWDTRASAVDVSRRFVALALGEGPWDPQQTAGQVEFRAASDLRAALQGHYLADGPGKHAFRLWQWAD